MCPPRLPQTCLSVFYPGASAGPLRPSASGKCFRCTRTESRIYSSYQLTFQYLKNVILSDGSLSQHLRSVTAHINHGRHRIIEDSNIQVQLNLTAENASNAIRIRLCSFLINSSIIINPVNLNYTTISSLTLKQPCQPASPCDPSHRSLTESPQCSANMDCCSNPQADRGPG